MIVSIGLTQIYDYSCLTCILCWVSSRTAFVSMLSAPSETGLVNFTINTHPSQWSVLGPCDLPQPLRNSSHSEAPFLLKYFAGLFFDAFHVFSLLCFLLQFQWLFLFNFCCIVVSSFSPRPPLSKHEIFKMCAQSWLLLSSTF